MEIHDDEPMTGRQQSRLKSLCQQANEAFEPRLTRGEASEQIEELEEKTSGMAEERQ